MKVLVSGGAGFIGSHIVDHLLAAGNEVVVLDDLSTGSLQNLNPEATFIKMNILDDGLLASVFGITVLRGEQGGKPFLQPWKWVSS